MIEQDIEQPQTTMSSDVRSTIQLDHRRAGIVGVKAGMSQVYDENGSSVGVTVISIKPNVVTQVRTKVKDGYKAIRVGVLDKKQKSANKPEQGHCKAANAYGFYYHKEFRLADEEVMPDVNVGSMLSVEFLKPGDRVDLVAISKGKGFQGGVKRYHMAGGYKSHGASLSHRQLGSIGNRADPSKCFKNKKMAGQMGNVKVTVQNVRVVSVDKENQIVLVHGSVPGPRSGLVTVYRAIKG